MFKLDCRIENRNIAKALAALGPLAESIRVAHIGPLKTQDVTRPKINGMRPSNDSSKEMVIAELRKLGGTINPAKMREVLTTLGYSPTSYSYFLNELAKSKLIKKTGKGRHSAYDWPKA